MTRPSWVNANEYPFESHHRDSETARMYNIDEGQGDGIVMELETPRKPS